MTSLNKLLLRGTGGRNVEHSQPETLSQGSGLSQQMAKVPVILKRAEAEVLPTLAQAPTSKESKPSSTSVGTEDKSSRNKSSKSDLKQILQRTGTPSETADRSGNTGSLPLHDLLAAYEFPYEQAVPIIHNDLSFNTNRKFLKTLKSTLDYLVVTAIGPPQSGKTTILNYLAGIDDHAEFNSEPKLFVSRKDSGGKLCTFYVTPQNIVFIEMASIFNGAAAVDFIPTVDKFSTLESVTTSWNLRLMRWALSVSHLVIVTSLAVIEPKTVQLIHSAANLYPMECAFGGDSHPELIFVGNKSLLPQASKEKLTTLCSTADIIGFGRRMRLKSNAFVLPHSKESRVDVQKEYEDFRRIVYEYNQWTRSSFTEDDTDGQAKIPQTLTMNDWFTFASNAWEEMGNPAYFQEYTMVKYYNPLCWMGFCGDVGEDGSVDLAAGSMTSGVGACQPPYIPIPLEFQLVFCCFSILSVFFQVILLSRMEQMIKDAHAQSVSIETHPEVNPVQEKPRIYTLPSLRKSLRVLFRSRPGSTISLTNNTQKSTSESFHYKPRSRRTIRSERSQSPAGRVHLDENYNYFQPNFGHSVYHLDKGTQSSTLECNVVGDHSQASTICFTLHQFPRGVESPAEVDALRVESVARIMELEHDVIFDASKESGIQISRRDEVLASGSTHCLEFLKTLTHEPKSEWDIPEQFAIPARFAISHLKGTFQGLVTIYKRGLWKGGNRCSQQELKTASEIELAWAFEKHEILSELDKSLNAIHGSLGHKKFLFGNKLTVPDGFAFAILAQMTWTKDRELNGLIKKFPNLIKYTMDIRSAIWSEWIPPPFLGDNPGSSVAYDVLHRSYYSDETVNMNRCTTRPEKPNQRAVSACVFCKTQTHLDQ